MPLNKSWHDYSESLIERGRVLIDVSFLKSSNKEIKKMNKGKVGAPFQHSDSYVQFLAFLKIGFKIPYRMVQGIVRGLAEYVKRRATGGNVMGHATTYRILLRKAGKARIAIMIDSPYHMYDQTRFSITEAGVKNIRTPHRNGKVI